MSIPRFADPLRWTICLGLAALLIAGSGCFEEDPVAVKEKEEEVVPPPLPTPLADLATVYGEMDLTTFVSLLHPQFEMIPIEQIMEGWGWPAGATFDRDEMITCHTNLFAGEPGRDSRGNPAPGIDSIVVELMERRNPWQEITAESQDFWNSRTVPGPIVRYGSGSWKRIQIMVTSWKYGSVSM